MSHVSKALTPERPLAKAPRMTALIDQFRAMALDLAKGDLSQWRGGSLLMVANVNHVVAEIFNELDDLARRVDVPAKEFRSLPELARAVHYAQLDVTGYVAVPAGQTPYQRLLELREIALLTARLGVRRGLLPKEEVQSIISGRGKADFVNDGARLERLYADKPDILVGPLVITPAEAEELGDIADDLLGDLKEPRNKARRANRPIYALVDLRNRLYSLLYQRWNRLLDAATAKYGRERAVELVFPLLSRVPEVKSNEEDIELPELDADATAPDATEDGPAVSMDPEKEESGDTSEDGGDVEGSAEGDVEEKSSA